MKWSWRWFAVLIAFTAAGKRRPAARGTGLEQTMWAHDAASVAHDHVQRLNRLDPIDDRAVERGGDSQRYELHFVALLDRGRGLGFPCDTRGGVDLDALSERARAI